MRVPDDAFVGDVAERVRTRLIAAGQTPTPHAVASAVHDEGLLVGDDALIALAGVLGREFSGAGPLEPLLRTPGITDVVVNGPDQVWIDDGNGLKRVDLSLRSEEQVRLLAQRLASAVGRRLDEAAPCVDAVMRDGTRLHAVIPPIATSGTVISLRIPRRHGFTVNELVNAGTLDAAGAAWLRAIVAARLSFLISGATGSGKTTILATLLGEVSHQERIVIVEDAAELQPVHPHVVALQSRPANVEGAGLITLRDLVRQALRMRPDRIVVGEVRGPEVIDLLAALNTGHEGGCGTVHANSASDIPARLEALGLMAGLDRGAVQALVAAGVQVLVHLGRDVDRRRFVEGIHVVTGQQGTATRSGVRVQGALLRRQGSLRTGPALSHLAMLIRSRGGVVPRRPRQ